MSDVGRCSSCQATVIWAQTPAGKRMPVDRPFTAAGTVALDIDTHPPTAHIVRAGSSPNLRTAHFATCPHAEQHRRPKPSAAPGPPLF